MAQKVTGYIKLQIEAGKATPAPPVGPALGQHGVVGQDEAAAGGRAGSCGWWWSQHQHTAQGLW